MKITIAGRGEVEFPVFTAGNFEDFEDEFNRILEHQGQNKQGIPTGKNLGAYVTVAHAVLKDKLTGLTRDELRASLKGVPAIVALMSAVIAAFGLPTSGASPGEAVSPAAST